MAPSAAIGSEDNDQDLKFLAEIKNEVPSSEKNSSSQIPDSVYLGMRRNSSFADYFEGDLSQNLLSRRFFPSLSDYSSSSSDHQHQEVINRLVNKIQNDNNINSTCPNPSAGDKKSKKFSEVILKKFILNEYQIIPKHFLSTLDYHGALVFLKKWKVRHWEAKRSEKDADYISPL